MKDYFLGFFFVLDVVSTASLVLDLTWARSLNEPIQTSESAEIRADNADELLYPAIAKLLFPYRYKCVQRLLVGLGRRIHHVFHHD